MQITIFNGNPDGKNDEFETYLRNLIVELDGRGHAVTLFVLRDLRLKACVGCFGCWFKRPGDCVILDDTRQIRQAYVGSDLALLSSPLRMGFVSSLLKQSMEKLLPTMLPFLELSEHGIHKQARYERNPDLGLLLQPDADTDDEDLEILWDIFRRTAVNFHTELVIGRMTSDPIQEVADAIDSV